MENLVRWKGRTKELLILTVQVLRLHKKFNCLTVEFQHKSQCDKLGECRNMIMILAQNTL